MGCAAAVAHEKPGWVVYDNIDMCGQGDVEIIHNWKSTHTIEQLQQIVEDKGYSAFTVSNGSPSFGHAALKKFDFALTKQHCKPISQCCRHPCKIYIYTKTAAKTQECQPCEAPTNVTLGFGKAAEDVKNVGNETNAESNAAAWSVHENIDMCGQGDVEIIGNWKQTHTIDQLKRIVEEKGYSAFTVSNGTPSFGHAALKKFDFALTKDHCKPISQCCRHPCKIYIYTPTHAKDQPREVNAMAAGKTVRMSGWTGYNERFNGDYTADGSSVNNRPVFKHMHSVGVGAGCDWCRLYWAHGAWRIGHIIWVHGDNKNAVAYVESDASHPLQIEPNSLWREHKGRSCGQDYGKEARDFQDVNSVTIAADSNIDNTTASNEADNRDHGCAEFLVLGMNGQELAKVTLSLGQPVKDLYEKVAEEIGETNAEKVAEVPSWSVHENIDMCGQGDVEIIHNWKQTHTIDKLKQIVEEKGYSAFTVSNGTPSFGHAALKKFDFALTKEHCKPISQCCRHPCKIYIRSGGPKQKQRLQLMLGNTSLNDEKRSLRDLGVVQNSTNSLTIVFKANVENQEQIDAAIQQAAWDGDAAKVERLLGEGADPNNYDGHKGNRHSALNGAARNGHMKCVQLLLDAKADIESKETYCGCTPLNQTCYHNRVEIARTLIRARANLDANCNFGTPLKMASERNHNEIRAMIERAKAGHSV